MVTKVREKVKSVKDLADYVKESLIELKFKEIYDTRKNRSPIYTKDPVKAVLGEFSDIYDGLSPELQTLIRLEKVDLGVFGGANNYSLFTSLQDKLKSIDIFPENAEVVRLTLNKTYRVTNKADSQTRDLEYDVVVLKYKDTDLSSCITGKNVLKEDLYDYDKLIELADAGEIFFLPRENNYILPEDYSDHMIKFRLTDAVGTKGKPELERMLLILTRQEFRAKFTQEMKALIPYCQVSLKIDEQKQQEMKERHKREELELADAIAKHTKFMEATKGISIE